eukprot:1158114-Pelagomonas_calceolata.AAC.2
MDILAQRKKVGNLSGQLLLNGKPAASGAVVRCAAYVPQVWCAVHLVQAEKHAVNVACERGRVP